jgi:hypothetical protein
MNLDVLTPSMWEMLRKLEYDQLKKFQMMMQPIEEEY